ncbi:hypothetical protein KAJ02_10625 [Candidatus Bipolaricaulota bacterium]|nr:hypothetical protein [Candidatus Bipolaricaulota bacterium]MCK5586513.1 hypothetical protein [Candidatus Bipolaricaulota bacterium]
MSIEDVDSDGEALLEAGLNYFFAILLKVRMAARMNSLRVANSPLSATRSIYPKSTIPTPIVIRSASLIEASFRFFCGRFHPDGDFSPVHQ